MTRWVEKRLHGVDQRSGRFGARAIAAVLIAAGACLTTIGHATDLMLDPVSTQLAMYKGHLSLSLSLDEKCHIMSKADNELIWSQWRYTMQMLNQVPIQTKRLIIVTAVQFEDDMLAKTACGPAAIDIVQDTIRRARKFQAETNN